MTVFDIVAEPIRIKRNCNKSALKIKVLHALRDVNLPFDDSFIKRTPSELSGGQRQRLSFARAIIGNPSVIIADEPTSMLDVSLRCELLVLMEKLRSECNVSFVFIYSRSCACQTFL